MIRHLELLTLALVVGLLSPHPAQAQVQGSDGDLEVILVKAIEYLLQVSDESVEWGRERGLEWSSGEVRITGLTTHATGEPPVSVDSLLAERVAQTTGIPLYRGRWICGSDEEQRQALSVRVEWTSPDQALVQATSSGSGPDGIIGVAGFPLIMFRSGGVWDVRGPPLPEGSFPRGVLRMGSHCDWGDRGTQHPPE